MWHASQFSHCVSQVTDLDRVLFLSSDFQNPTIFLYNHLEPCCVELVLVTRVAINTLAQSRVAINTFAQSEHRIAHPHNLKESEAKLAATEAHCERHTLQVFMFFMLL